MTVPITRRWRKIEDVQRQGATTAALHHADLDEPAAFRQGKMEEGLMRDDEGLHHAPASTRSSDGDRHDHALVDAAELGIGAAAGDAHHPIAGPIPLTAKHARTPCEQGV